MLLNIPWRHTQKLVHKNRRFPACWPSSRNISSYRLIGAQSLRRNSLAPPTNNFYKSSSFSTSYIIRAWNQSSLSPTSSYVLHSIISPSVSDIVRTLSNKTPKEEPTTIETNTNEDIPTFLQKVYNGTKEVGHLIHGLLFIEFPVLLPRILAFISTLHIVNEYGLQTICCEGPSMEPTIIDGSNSCVLIERWSHRLFGLEERNYENDIVEQKKKTSTIEERDKSSHHDDGEEVDDQTSETNSWYTLLYGVWKQHFASGLDNGDVIILHHPMKDSTVCKRIIGMPGDTIIRTDGGDREYNHRRIVPPGHLWIEGDNTLNSLDSRSYGMVPASLVIGKVICRLFPLREYALIGIDANGMEHWERVSARIGRGERPSSYDKDGSHVLATTT